MEQAELWQLAMANERVIYGALKHERIWRKRDDWQDLVHEGFMVYVASYDKYAAQQSQPFDVVQFNRFAFQAICWHIRNLLRRDMWLAARTQIQLDQVTDEPSEAALQITPSDQAFIIEELLPAIKSQLTARQQTVLVEHLLKGQKLTRLSQQLHVSPRTLRNDRQQIVMIAKKLHRPELS
ncbi:sigma-70 family RNA polymerase sigma factor [Agrilactobacillus fermenti]|uniref:sigma-70 family RNA polymerase sigma factor n=1 Tax=Agrilactobacillus fermenti TaxID=2586909 RepID=UPI003A5BDEFB